MRRTNLFWSADRGDLEPVNTKVKLAVPRFLFYRDYHDPLLRSAVQGLGDHRLPTVAGHHDDVHGGLQSAVLLER